MPEMETRHFLTVQWCGKGPRGVFCRKDGAPAVQDEPWTTEQMQHALNAFWIILNPQSQEMTEEELARCNRFVPLAEYCGEYGIAFES